MMDSNYSSLRKIVSTVRSEVLDPPNRDDGVLDTSIGLNLISEILDLFQSMDQTDIEKEYCLWYHTHP